MFSFDLLGDVFDLFCLLAGCFLFFCTFGFLCLCFEFVLLVLFLRCLVGSMILSVAHVPFRCKSLPLHVVLCFVLSFVSCLGLLVSCWFAVACGCLCCVLVAVA